MSAFLALILAYLISVTISTSLSVNPVVTLTSLLTISSVYSLSSNCNGGSCTPLSAAEKQAILDIHNELRDRTAGGGLPGHPAATDMNHLIWDDGLANVAQAYVESCPGLNHNNNRESQYATQRDAGNTKWGPDSSTGDISVGENLAVNGAAYSINRITSQIESGWYDEWQDWSYGNYNLGCSDVCGHYTQMVWANTRYVGCGYANGCSSGWASVFVCNYFPAGNFNYVPPYTSGTACSNCMSDRPQCKSEYVSRSTTAGSYPSQPYNALCDGGACPTMCDGDSYSRSTCDGTGCDGNNNDCNDGTINKNNGRSICGTDQPTSATNNPTPPQPTRSPVTKQPTAPTTTTLQPTKAPISGPPPCLMLSNYQFSGWNGQWDYNNQYDGKPSYYHSVGGYYLEWIGAWNYNALPDGHGSTTIYGYCNQADIWNCGTNTWYYYSSSAQDFLLDSNAAIAPCPTAPTTKAPTKAPTTKSPTKVPTGNTLIPTSNSHNPTANTLIPTSNTPSPTLNTATPTSNTPGPTKTPSNNPTLRPTIPPTNNPTLGPTQNPLIPGSPTIAPTPPTPKPSTLPSKFPTETPTSPPSKKPTKVPSKAPSSSPSKKPTTTPSDIPTRSPITKSPTQLGDTLSPSASPSKSPSNAPTTTATPTQNPTPTRPPTTCDGSLSQTNQIFITYTIHWTTGQVEIEFKCPISHWCGVGFDATQMSDNPYTLVISSDSTINDFELLDHQFTTPLTNRKISNSQLSVGTTETIATITIPITASNGFNYDTIISNGNRMNMIWSVSPDGHTIWDNTKHESKGWILIACSENTFNPTNSPITNEPTLTPITNSIEPTRRPTWRPWHQCYKNANIRKYSKRCKYNVRVEIDIELTFDNSNTNILIHIITNEIENRWTDLLDDRDNMEITISIINTNADATGNVEITVMVGIENDEMYNGHFTTRGDNGAIENGLKSELIDNGFTIGQTSSTFTLLEIFIETTNDNQQIQINNDNSGSVMLDFANYGAVDWILFAVIILIIIIGIVLCIFCIIKLRRNKINRETSKMGISTGIKQAELTQISGYKKTRPKAVVSFGSNHELATQENLAFNAAIQGVALIKVDTNVDLMEGEVVQTHIIAAEESTENTPPIIETQNDFDDTELMAFSGALLDQQDGALPQTNDDNNNDNYAVVNTVIDNEEYEYEYEYEYEDYEQPQNVEQVEVEVEAEPVVALPPPIPAAAMPPPVPAAIKNKYKKPEKKEEPIVEPIVQPIEVEIKAEPEPEPIIEPVIEEAVEKEEEIKYFSIEECKKQKGTNKEEYLNDNDFQTVFGMDKNAFQKLPKWKQKNIKKAKGFF